MVAFKVPWFLSYKAADFYVGFMLVAGECNQLGASSFWSIKLCLIEIRLQKYFFVVS